MTVGRITLAADAAHLCNPFGGMGLTGGLVDVGDLADFLKGIKRGVASNEILEKYSEIRRQKWRDAIDPISSSNFIRVSATDPERAREVDPFLKTVKTMETNGSLRKEFDDVSRSSLIIRKSSD
jgi:2-polyprenyl-6-methoxyphenol hydroxylase-like FAD-dependent oxidoreductase